MAFFGVSARNQAQKGAMQALNNEKPYMFITGPAGGGKSLIAQAVGLENVVETRRYRKLIYTRLQAQLGMEIGHLPGSIDEKTYPFIRPFLDNLEAMSDESKRIVQYLMTGGDKAQIFFDPIQTMRGGTFHKSFVLVDEVQNLDVGTMHGVATRLGPGTKMVFCGNFAQVDTQRLRKPSTNGMYQLLNGLYERGAHDIFDHVNLMDIERHYAVGVVEDILRNHDMAPEFADLEARGNTY
ncbi:PhoH family protein [Neobacillus niacini]|uniref:PhoH family protein n=1 Tax=Neobacillus niacini TaxID=86668 RepID=UPI002859369B|nr:PhoH family protein [Neobacillus niacini]MDR7001596.1 putative ribonuclease YlaK [Neobacillus niacini]